MSRHRAPRTLRQRAADLATWARGDLPTNLLPWLLMLGACLANTGIAIHLRHWATAYSTALVTLIVFAAVLHIWVAHTDPEQP
jgi:membrane protein YdbS with pleckstrin-like domain